MTLVEKSEATELRSAIQDLQNNFSTYSRSLDQAVVHIDYLREALIGRRHRFWGVVLGFTVPALIAVITGAWWAANVTNKLDDIVQLKSDVAVALAQTDDRFRRSDFAEWRVQEFMPVRAAILKYHSDERGNYE